MAKVSKIVSGSNTPLRWGAAGYGWSSRRSSTGSCSALECYAVCSYPREAKMPDDKLKYDVAISFLAVTLHSNRGFRSVFVLKSRTECRGAGGHMESVLR
jgi:hypothetical protein